MLSDFDDLFKSDSFESFSDFEESTEDLELATREPEPYQDKPLVRESKVDESEETDLDGLTPADLEARFERRVAVCEWCKCQQ
ncbi:hypothetical protein ACROYT_G013938 [Oculina patagonica]